MVVGLNGQVIYLMIIIIYGSLFEFYLIKGAFSSLVLI